MKELLYRLPSSRSFAKLFSILAVAVVAFAALELFFVQQSLAGTKCCLKTNTSSCYCDSLSAVCNSTSYFANGTCTTTRTGGTGGGGSHYDAVLRFADEVVSIIVEGDNTVPAEGENVCGPGFFDVKSATAEDQAVSCTFTPTGGTPDPEAQCVFKDLRCSCFAEGKCTATGPKPGTRISTMTCGTNDPITGLNLAGCTGSVDVFKADGITPLALNVPIGQGLADLNTSQECGDAFGNAFGLKKGVMGTITQQCSVGSNVLHDRVVKQVVRSTNEYQSTTEWLDQYPATCNPANGFPRHACTNAGGTWVTVLNPNPAGSAQACRAAAANLSCGQNSDGSPGPAPSQCRISGGQCECRCDRCNEDTGEALVNAGQGDQGVFVLASRSVAPLWVAACPVTTEE
jgi:hypothetical protein